MSATDTIRAMLVERGVEWEACRVPTLCSELAATFWYDRDGNPCSAVEGADDTPDGKLSVNANLTPEQAIEATLGRGECRDVCNDVAEFTCSACGFNCDLTSWISLFDGDDGRHRHHHHGTPNYCPNCGRKVMV